MPGEVMTYPLPSTGRTKQAARDAKERFDLYIQACELLVQENDEALQLVRSDRRPTGAHLMASRDCDQTARKSGANIALEAKVRTVILAMLVAMDGTNSELLRDLGLFANDDYWALRVDFLSTAERLLGEYRSGLQPQQRESTRPGFDVPSLLPCQS